jgi:uncharacterized 2Fe-2S/4Fe-4S cluster protein (DUF4445 family)
VIVIFEPEGRKTNAKVGKNLLEIAQDVGVRIRSDCGGEGTCGKCKVLVDNSGNFNGISGSEVDHLTEKERATNYRLACRTTLSSEDGESVINIPPESKFGARRFQLMGTEREIESNPAISKVHVSLSEPSLKDPLPDIERIISKLTEQSNLIETSIDLDLMKNVSEVLRDAEWDITAAIWKGERIVSVEKHDTTDRLYGFAVDVGTSKVVGHLVDLQSGETLFANAVENPQLPYGEDVMSRITYSSRSDDNLFNLSSLVRNAINGLIEESCSKSPESVSPNEIYEFVMVGNTVMHHILLGIPPYYLSQAPYVPILKRPIDIPSREIGLRGNPGSSVHMLPIAAGFVGADAIAGVIATNMHESEETCMLIDIGTNTEVFLGNKEGLICCSCASGPAFEGMHLKHGMKATSGAIEKVDISPDANEVVYETVDAKKAVGICGSGIIDIVGDLFKHGIINKRGYFTHPKTNRFIEVDQNPEFVIAWKDEAAGNEDITVSEEDILVVLLAKAAIEAGFNILMKKEGLNKEDIDRIYIAGAFGKHLNVANAKILGLIPNVPSERITCVGNSAITGAKMCLMSTEMRDEASSISMETRYVELAAEPQFAKEFSHSLFIPHRHPDPLRSYLM